jgi:hypothetical protein
VRTVHHRLWIGVAACGAVAIAIASWFYVSRTRPDEKTVAASEDEVYEAVVRDMVMPSHGPARVGLLIFDDTLLTELAPGTDINSCKEGLLKRLALEDKALPPFNTFADRIYRVLTQGWYDSSPRPEAIQDFLGKSCSVGTLSTTFRTDLPRTFIATRDVHFKGWPIENKEEKSFEELFPGAPGIISFSHVGFDSGLHEAIVSTSFVCGGLCGTGHRYVLKKKWGKWRVVNKWITWVS